MSAVSGPEPDRRREVLHAALRGAIGAMAMTGMREFTVEAGIVEQTSPQAIAKQRRARGLVRRISRSRRRAAVELAHWSYGTIGGAGFGLLPDGLRRRRWAGPAYGLASWLAFELGVAPLLGLAQAGKVRPLDRAALLADHLLYGLLLSETRRRPQG